MILKKIVFSMIVLFLVGCKPADDGMVEIKLPCEKTKSCVQVLLRDMQRGN
jgi:hypothetical protein